MNIGALTQAMLQSGAAMPPTALRGGEGGGSFLAEVNRGLEATRSQALSSPDESSAVQPKSLEDRLKLRYPGLAYHVFDGSSRHWRSRQDYPFHKIYQQDADVSEIENWQPSGPNPDPLDPQVQRNLSSIPPGSKAVIIHPKVQQRMEEDPAYAEVIYRRIEAWFTFDVARNEAILPGCTMGMSQCLAIGEDGQIANVQACSSGGSLSQSKSGDDEEDFWDARTKCFRLYMEQVVEAQLLHRMGIAGQFSALSRSYKNTRDRVSSGGSGMSQQMAALGSAQSAIAETMAMMEGTQLRAALGETVAGVSIDTVFQCTREAIANRPVLY